MSVRSGLFVLFGVFFPAIAYSGEQELLRGEVQLSAEETRRFSLNGESRQQVVGGDIAFGSKHFQIMKVSVHNLLGAYRQEGDRHEYAVFSSSYSDQTATGEPWVVADTKLNCSIPYNSFLVIYTVESSKKIASLSEFPYGDLAETLSLSDSSELFCFYAQPPKLVSTE